MPQQTRDDTRAATLRGLVPEDLFNFRWLTELALSPDGSTVAYTVRRPDAARNGYTSDLYLLDLESRATRKLTGGEGQATSLAWSRDGERLAYVWRGDSGASIEVAARDGTPVHSYPLEGAAPEGLDWSPDSKRLAFSRWTGVRGWEERGPAPGIPAPTIRVIRRLRYKQNGPGWVENRYRHIWVLELDTADVVQLTGGECDYREPRWSWDGQHLAFTGIAREQNTPLGQGQILVSSYPAGEVRLLMEGWEGAAVSPQWRADDGAIAFAGYRSPPPVNRRLFYHVWQYDLASGEATELSGDVDQTVGNYAVADQRAGLTNVTVKWPEGDGPIYFLLTEQGATHLYSVREGEPIQKRAGHNTVVFDYAASRNGRVIYGEASPRSIGELYLLDTGNNESERLTNLNPWLASRKLSEPREYWYEGLDGARVHAWEMRPVGREEGKLYPTIVYVHCSMFSWDFNHEFQCLANAGFVVAYFNQRGTTAGYGQEHALGNYYGKQNREFDEIMLGVDDLIQRPYVDASRLGVTGGSCGGYMTNWIIGHTSRFAAAVTQRSVTNLVSKFGTSDNGPEQAESEGAQGPWRDVETLWRNSPIAYAEQVRTPLLIVHSDEDYRCPLSQAEELYAALRWFGREVELVIFEGENHELSRGGRPGNRIERLRRISGWFERHLHWPDNPPPGPDT
jgi:dipeptidyl aminopeptidase/acylaminoacyl peptidase